MGWEVSVCIGTNIAFICWRVGKEEIVGQRKMEIPKQNHCGATCIGHWNMQRKHVQIQMHKQMKAD